MQLTHNLYKKNHNFVSRLFLGNNSLCILFKGVQDATQRLNDDSPSSAHAHKANAPSRVRWLAAFHAYMNSTQRKLVVHAVEAMRAESTLYRTQDDINDWGSLASLTLASNPKLWACLFHELQWLVTVRSHHAVYFTILLAVFINGNVFALVPVFALFSWAVISPSTYPSKAFFVALGSYTLLVLVCKYTTRVAMKFSSTPTIDTMSTTDTLGLTDPSDCRQFTTDGLCSSTDGCRWVDDSCLQLPAFQADLIPDVLVLLSICVHRIAQTRLGIWDKRVQLDQSHNVAPTTSADTILVIPSKTGKDYTSVSFAIQFVALLISIFGYGQGFTTLEEASVVNAGNIVANNVVPPVFLFYLIFQLSLMIVDRVSGRAQKCHIANVFNSPPCP